MEVLGHSQIGLTMNLYSHVMKPALQNAADRMDSLLTRKPAPWLSICLSNNK